MNSSGFGILSTVALPTLTTDPAAAHGGEDHGEEKGAAGVYKTAG